MSMNKCRRQISRIKGNRKVRKRKGIKDEKLNQEEYTLMGRPTTQNYKKSKHVSFSNGRRTPFLQFSLVLCIFTCILIFLLWFPVGIAKSVINHFHFSKGYDLSEVKVENHQ